MLPNRILNPDKQFHESWSSGRNLLNIPHPFRAVFLGPPGSGKSTAVKNIILRIQPFNILLFATVTRPLRKNIMIWPVLC